MLLCDISIVHTSLTQHEMCDFIKACQHPSGGIGGNIGHVPHITTTLYGLLILAMFDSVKVIDTEALADYVSML